MPEPPSRFVTSSDGTPIAVFSSGHGPPLILVHGAAADHTTFRVAGPLFAERFRVHAIDRRGRGASGDGPGYDVRREFEDIAAVAAAISVEAGRPADVVGHSFGGRVTLGAALGSPPAIRRAVVYEGAPPAPRAPYQERELPSRLRALLAERGPEALLEVFLGEVVGLAPDELAAYRANPVWPARVAAAATIVRELEAEISDAAGLEALGRVEIPVLQVLGGASRAPFRIATEALDARLRDGRVVTIEGAKHAAHHTHAGRFVSEVETFLAG